MNMKKLFIVFLTLIALSLAACQSKTVTGETVQVEGGSYTNVSASDLAQMLKNKDFVFINVHIPFDGNIAGTDLSIPYDEIGSNLSQLPADKNAQVVLYCRSGRMSQMAAEALVKLGYTDIWNLEGGMVEWEQAGYNMEQ